MEMMISTRLWTLTVLPRNYSSTSTFPHSYQLLHSIQEPISNVHYETFHCPLLWLQRQHSSFVLQSNVTPWAPKLRYVFLGLPWWKKGCGTVVWAMIDCLHNSVARSLICDLIRSYFTAHTTVCLTLASLPQSLQPWYGLPFPGLWMCTQHTTMLAPNTPPSL